MKRAIIVGSRGQDGQLLTQLLRKNGIEVLGIGNGVTESPDPTLREPIDLYNPTSIRQVLRSWQPDGIFYLAAYHHSSQDAIADTPLELYQKSEAIHVRGLLHFLEAIRADSPATRLFYAASSLAFGNASTSPQTEETPLNPNCGYGITKASGVQYCRLYRRSLQVFASAAFLYNHESPLRAERFVSQKIVRAAVAIASGSPEKLQLGDLSTRIDWGYAGDFVDAMFRILQLPEAGDFVIATGQPHSIKEFVEIAFSRLNLDWRDHVVENPNLVKRRTPPLAGDATKLKELTGWQPSVSFEEMIEILLQAAQSKLAK